MIINAADYTKRKNYINNFDEALETFDLDFNIESREIGFMGDSGFTTITDNNAIIRTDNQKILGVVGSTYPDISPSEKFEPLKKYVDNGTISIVDGGNIGKNGGIHYLQGVINETITPNPKVNDITECRITFTTSSNGMKANEILLTPYRLACSNGMVIADAVKTKRFKNTKNVSYRIPEMDKYISIIMAEYTKFDEFISSCFNTVELKERQIDGFIEKLIPSNDTPSTRILNMRDELKDSMFNGVGQDIISKKNLYWLVQGVTTWTNNVKATMKDDPVNYILYGQGNTYNMSALSLIDNALAHGNEVFGN